MTDIPQDSSKDDKNGKSGARDTSCAPCRASPRVPLTPSRHALGGSVFGGCGVVIGLTGLDGLTLLQMGGDLPA